MTWYDDIIEVMEVGDVKTVPELVDLIHPKHPKYFRNVIRSHLCDQMINCSKYGIMRKVGKTENHQVLWERIL